MGGNLIHQSYFCAYNFHNETKSKEIYEDLRVREVEVLVLSTSFSVGPCASYLISLTFFPPSVPTSTVNRGIL